MRSSLRTAGWTLAAALIVLIAAEALRIYWIMPLPGSQQGETVGLAYAIHRGIWFVRLAVGAVGLWAAVQLLRRGRWWARALAVAGIAAYALVAWRTNGPMSADVMFRQPTTLTFAGPETASLAPEALVVGVALTDGRGKTQARAYPLQFIGYHHQVRDTVAEQPVMVTYCTVCRTGRVFSPVVGNEVDDFRLVGMDHWNAMFEDRRTGSWWRQATGVAAVGPRKGERLPEIPSRQMTWAAWSALHPESDVMEPDPQFAEIYPLLKGFAEGTNKSRLTGRDPASWNDKSWVVGVLANGAARAFDWNELVRERLIADQVGDVPVILLLAPDGASFHAFDARLGETTLALEATDDPARFRDPATGALWTDSGLALDGPATGTLLTALPAYQEFWHSWRTFHPETTARR